MAGKLLYIAGGTVLVVGTAAYFYQQYQLTDKLCYGVDNFHIKKASLDHMVFGVDLIIKNSGTLKVDVSKIKFDIFANDTKIATVAQDQQFTIKPTAKSMVPFSAAFSPRQMFQSLGQIFMGSSALNQTTLRFKGYATVKKLGIPIPIPFNFSYTIAELKDPPEKSKC